jgi:glutaredoxin 3
VAAVTLYTTDECSFCRCAKALLDQRGVVYKEIFIPRADREARLALMARTGLATMPQVVVDGRPLGGWEDLRRLDADADGRLRSALSGSGS